MRLTLPPLDPPRNPALFHAWVTHPHRSSGGYRTSTRLPLMLTTSKPASAPASTRSNAHDAPDRLRGVRRVRSGSRPTRTTTPYLGRADG